MKTMLLALALLPVLAALGCSGGDPELDVTEEALATGHFSARFGASGDIVKAADLQVFDDLHGRGMNNVRLVTYLSYGRGPSVLPPVTDPINALITQLDMFVSVFVAECGDSYATGCHDLWEGVATNAADKPIIKNAFKALFQPVVDAANPMVNGVPDLRVKTWAVNEPDNAMGRLPDWPERAALFYLGAREVLDASGCGSCKLVAGEFSRFDGKRMAVAFKRYVAELHRDGQFPTIFSLHPYGDVNAVTSGDWTTIHASETDAYEKSVKAVDPTAQIWLTEVGRMIFEPSVSHTPENEWASGAYVRHRLAYHPSVTRVYWYQMAASTSGWDTALADAEGRHRASFYGLIGEDESSALDAAKTDGSDPAPDQ